MKKDFPDFGIMVDLSHLPIQDESPRKSLGTLKKMHIAHIHIGNAVKQQGHSLYGDLHPRFGTPGGENDVPQLVEFLKALFEIEYLGKGKRPIVAFEVKPYGEETSGVVIANAKRTLVDAWARA
jgi:sugar phosphate isomerase/epimerase